MDNKDVSNLMLRLTTLCVLQKSPMSKVPKPASEPPSPSLSRTSSPPASVKGGDELDDDNGEIDSEEEREELGKANTIFQSSPAGSVG